MRLATFMVVALIVGLAQAKKRRTQPGILPSRKPSFKSTHSKISKANAAAAAHAAKAHVASHSKAHSKHGTSTSSMAGAGKPGRLAAMIKAGESVMTGSMCVQVSIAFGDPAGGLGLQGEVAFRGEVMKVRESNNREKLVLDGMFGVGITFISEWPLIPKGSGYSEFHGEVAGYPWEDSNLMEYSEQMQAQGTKREAAGAKFKQMLPTPGVKWLLNEFFKQRVSASPFMKWAMRKPEGMKTMLDRRKKVVEVINAERQKASAAQTAAGGPAIDPLPPTSFGADLTKAFYDLHAEFMDRVSNQHVVSELVNDATWQKYLKEEDGHVLKEMYTNWIFMQWRAVYTPAHPLESIDFAEVGAKSAKETMRKAVDTSISAADKFWNFIYFVKEQVYHRRFSCYGASENFAEAGSPRELAQRLLCVHFASHDGQMDENKAMANIRSFLPDAYPELFPGCLGDPASNCAASKAESAQVRSWVDDLEYSAVHPPFQPAQDALALAFEVFRQFVASMMAAAEFVASSAKYVLGTLGGYDMSGTVQTSTAAIEQQPWATRTVLGRRYDSFVVTSVFQTLGNPAEVFEGKGAGKTSSFKEDFKTFREGLHAKADNKCNEIEVSLERMYRFTTGSSEVGYCTPDTNVFQFGAVVQESAQTDTQTCAMGKWTVKPRQPIVSVVLNPKDLKTAGGGAGPFSVYLNYGEAGGNEGVPSPRVRDGLAGAADSLFGFVFQRLPISVKFQINYANLEKAALLGVSHFPVLAELSDAGLLDPVCKAFAIASSLVADAAQFLMRRLVEIFKENNEGGDVTTSLEQIRDDMAQQVSEKTAEFTLVMGAYIKTDEAKNKMVQTFTEIVLRVIRGMALQILVDPIASGMFSGGTAYKGAADLVGKAFGLGKSDPGTAGDATGAKFMMAEYILVPDPKTDPEPDTLGTWLQSYDPRSRGKFELMLSLEEYYGFKASTQVEFEVPGVGKKKVGLMSAVGAIAGLPLPDFTFQGYMSLGVAQKCNVNNWKTDFDNLMKKAEESSADMSQKAADSQKQSGGSQKQSSSWCSPFC